MYYRELEKREVTTEYRQFPPIREFDLFGKLNLTEVLRHRNIVDHLIDELKNTLDPLIDIDVIKSSLLTGISSRLLGEVNGKSSNYRHSIFSTATGVEQTANLLIELMVNEDASERTLGQKLASIRDSKINSSKYFINEKFLNYLTLLLNSIRNEVVHPHPEYKLSSEELRIKASLSSILSTAFIDYATKALKMFVTNSGEVVEVEFLSDSVVDADTIVYVGFDGDATGEYLERAFTDKSSDAIPTIRSRSHSISTARVKIVELIETNSDIESPVIFAEGDDIFFSCYFNPDLLKEIQEAYTTFTGLTSSIGFGMTPHEASTALRLAKAESGNSVVGVKLI